MTSFPPPTEGRPLFTLEVTPGPEDIDALGHVSNLVYLRWVQDVARAHSDARGYDLAAYRALGAVFVVRRHELEYLAETRAGERLSITTWVAEWRGASSWRQTRIERAADGARVCEARTRWAFVDLEHGRPRRIPRGLITGFDGG